MWFVAALPALWLLQASPVDEGLKALEEQRYEAAAQAFTKAVAEEPGDYSRHFHLALAHTMLKRDAEAILSYKKVLELRPGLYEAQLNLGTVLLRAKQPGEAKRYLAEASKQKPGEVRALVLLGEAELAAGDAAAAEAAFRSAISLDAASLDATLGLARALDKQGRVDDAAALFRKAGSPDALLELAALYERAKRPGDAIPIYEKFSDNPAARERLGELLLETGRAADAIVHLEFAVAKSPTPANRYALAVAYIQQKQVDKAAPLLQSALAAEPGNVELRMLYARALRESRNFAAAAQEFYKVAQAKPESVEAWSDLAGMLILTENYPGAVAALDRVKALGGEKPGHHFFRAITLDKQKLYEPALAAYQKFLDTSGGASPDEEFKARQRMKAIKKELEKR